MMNTSMNTDEDHIQWTDGIMTWTVTKNKGMVIRGFYNYKGGAFDSKTLTPTPQDYGQAFVGYNIQGFRTAITNRMPRG